MVNVLKIVELSYKIKLNQIIFIFLFSRVTQMGTTRKWVDDDENYFLLFFPSLYVCTSTEKKITNNLLVTKLVTIESRYTKPRTLLLPILVISYEHKKGVK